MISDIKKLQLKYLAQVTALFPYLVLIIFFIRAVTLRGMEDGIAHLFTPKVGPAQSSDESFT